MRPLLAIAALTWKSSFRYRLFWVLAAALLAAVIGLPVLLKDDGTARGFVQILLTYTLSTTMFLLGVSTLWLSCGTLARDVEECQIQMVVVKPVSRWQIWLGKWLGILALNAALLGLAGVSIYSLLMWRASRLPQSEQQILREEILAARASVKPRPLPIQEEIQRRWNALPNRGSMSNAEQEETIEKLSQQVLTEAQIVPGRAVRAWQFDLGLASRNLGDQPLFVRYKFFSASTNEAGRYRGVWQFGTPGNPLLNSSTMAMAPDSYQEFQVSSEVLKSQSQLTVFFQSQEDTALLFPLEDGIEILYRDGSFGLNFLRGLGILLSWLALLSALGLAAASVTSFPVAAFCSLSALVVVLSSSTLSDAVANQSVLGGRPDEFQTVKPVLNALFLPLFKGILAAVNVLNVASPVELLSAGRSITWELVAAAWLQVVGLAGGFLALLGTWLLSRRELATAQGTH